MSMSAELGRPVREILNIAAPVSILVGDVTDENTVKIKGFVSVENVDRSGDIVPPEEFDIAQFMAAPSMLVNHKFWISSDGNPVGVGRPLEMFVGKLVKGDKPDEYGIRNESTKKIVDSFPKSKVPNLSLGTRGLFVVAEVTERDVVKRVRRGELASFSWKGLATVDYRVNAETGRAERVLKDIDLYEFSLVNMADNPSSTFTIGKTIQSMRLDKLRFPNERVVCEYAKKHSLNSGAVREDADAFFTLELPQSYFDMAKLEVVKMADGVQAIIGDMRKSHSENWLNQTLGFALTKNLATTHEETAKMATETKKPEETTTETPEKMTQEKGLEMLAEKMGQVVVNGLKPVLEQLGATSIEHSSLIKALTEKMSPEAEEKSIKEAPDDESDTDTEKANVSKAFDVLNTLADNLKGTQGQLAEVAKTVSALAKATPKGGVEREETLKTVDDAEVTPNDCFDGLMPFLKV